MRLKQVFCFLVIVVCFLPEMKSQAGKEFWFAAPDVTSGHSREGGKQRYLCVTSQNLPTKVTVSQPANPEFPVLSYILEANQVQMIDLSVDSFQISPSNDWVYKTENLGMDNFIENVPPDHVNNFGILIESEELITAYYEVRSRTNPEIWSLKSEEALGTYFWVPMQNLYTNGNYTPPPFNEVHIVASEDNTVVTINNSTAAVGHAAGSSFSITLNKGQTYNLRAVGFSGPEHLSGTRITSTKPVAITISDDSIIKTGYACKDVNGDQLVPVDYIGTDYIVSKGQLTDGERVFITAIQNETEIYTGTNTIATTTIDAGETYSIPLAAANTYIRTSEQAYVYHLGGFGCEMGGALVPSIYCTGSHEVWFSRANTQPFFLNLMVPAGGESEFWIEYEDEFGDFQSLNLPATLFESVAGTGGSVDKGLANERVIPQYMALNASVNISKYFNFIPEQTAIKVYNTSMPFQMGMYFGGSSTGCSYGYFSDFGKLLGTAEFADNDGSYLKACYGDTVQLIAYGGMSYKWKRFVSDTINNNTFLSSTDISNPKVLAPTGAHKYVAQIKGGIPNICPLDTPVHLILLVASPISAEFNFPDSVMCPADSIKIINKSLGVDKEYYWDFDDGTFETINSNFDTAYYHHFNNKSLGADTFNVYLKVKNQMDCYKEEIKQLVLYPEVFSDFDTSIVLSGYNGKTVTFTNLSSGDLSGFDWYLGEGEWTTVYEPQESKTYLNFGNIDSVHNLMLVAKSPYGCTDSTIKSLTIDKYLAANFEIISSDDCAITNVTLKNNSSGNISNVIWAIEHEQEVGSFDDLVKQFTNNSDTIRDILITLKVEDGNGRMDSLYQILSLYGSDYLHIDSVKYDSLICNGDKTKVSIFAKACSGDELLYFYDNNTQYQDTNCLFGINAGEYVFKVKDVNENIDSFYLDIFQPDFLPDLIIEGDLDVKYGSSRYTVNNFTNDSILWFVQGGEILSATNQYADVIWECPLCKSSDCYVDGPLEGMIVANRVESCNDRASYLDVEIDCGTSIDRNSGEDFNIYPNPTNGILTIDFGLNNFSKLEVLDLTGQNIAVINCKGEMQVDIDLNHLQNGIYFIKAYGEIISVKQVIVQ